MQFAVPFFNTNQINYRLLSLQLECIA